MQRLGLWGLFGKEGFLNMLTLDRMVAGFRSFKAAYYEQRPERVTSLVEGQQRPEVVLVACSDSRVDPAILMRSEPGELFVVRNVAALVPPHEPDGSYHGTSAALEFAVCDLRVRDAVVLGHSACGGMSALVASRARQGRGEAANHAYINPWMAMMADVAVGQPVDSVGRATVVASLQNLRTFPFIAAAEARGELRLHGWWFDMREGTLSCFDQQTGNFNKLA